MSNKGDFDRKDLNTFKMLMMYLNPIGSVGTNVDMYWDDIEFETIPVKLLSVLISWENTKLKQSSAKKSSGLLDIFFQILFYI